MVKQPSKKPAANSGKPITDFFMRKTLGQNGAQLQDSSQTSTTTSDSVSPARLRSSSKKSSVASSGSTNTLQKSPHKTRTVMDALDVSSPRKTVKSQDENTPTTSRKRSRSPDLNNPLTPLLKSRGRAKSPKKPTPLDNDNGGGESASRRVIHVRPAPSKKKAKLTSPEISPPDTGSLVPSSQSDEIEVTPALQKIVNTSHWRKQASPISPVDPTGDEMEVDIPETFHSVVDPVARVVESTPESSFTSVFDQMLTPPLTERPSDEPLPSSPIILDRDTKAARIIAEIKAKAIAAVTSSPELLPSLDLGNSPDDSSDEEEMTFSHFNQKSSPLENRTEGFSNGRYDLRNRNTKSRGSASRDQSPLLGRNTHAVPRNIAKEPIISAKMNGKKKAAPSFNPLDAMLKEKRLAEKRGGDDKAFRLAEDVSNRFGKHNMLNEMDEEEDNAELDNEAIAKMAVRERDRYMMKSSSPETSTGSFDDILFNDWDGQQLLGDGRGKAIVGILEGDRQMSEEDKKFQKYVGITLWTGSRGSKSAMEIEGSSPTFDFVGEHPILKLLKSSSDISMTTLLLNSGLLSNLVDKQSDLISSLSKTGETPLSSAAFRSLLHIFGQETGSRPGISFSSVLSTLLYLGADPSIIESAGWLVKHEGHVGQLDADKREDILFRLLILLQVSAKRLAEKEIPDIVLAVLLVGMDSWTPEALHQDIINTLNTICLSIAPGNDIQTETEIAICNKALQCAANYEPVNKFHLVRFLSSGSGRTRRIASWLAHGILVDTDSITAEQYSERPPLAQLISVFEIVKTGAQRGKFELHEATDYVDLGFYVSLLSIAISDVKGYVAEERSTARFKARAPLLTGSPTKSAYEKEDTELLVVKDALERIHNKIIDTQAAHLDRTRTKASIKGTAMRIHFQRQQFLSTRSTSSGPRTSLRQYFKSK